MSQFHFTCSICEANGFKFQYYRDYDDMELHWRECHFPCKEPECLARKFVVFETDIALKSHYLQAHINKLSQKAKKQMRQIASSGNVAESSVRAPNPNRGQTIAWEKKSETSKKAEFLPVTSMSYVVESLKRQVFHEETEEKTQRLVRVLKLCLGNDSTRFKYFRELSLQFSIGEVRAEEYYEQIIEIFGKKADIVFPLLVGTIPEEKQRISLQAVHDRVNRKAPSPNVRASASQSAKTTNDVDEGTVLVTQAYFYFSSIAYYVSSILPPNIDEIFPISPSEYDSMTRIFWGLQYGEALGFRLIDVFKASPLVSPIMKEVLAIYEESGAKNVEAIDLLLRKLSVYDLHRIVHYCYIMEDRALHDLNGNIDPTLDFIDSNQHAHATQKDFELEFPSLKASASTSASDERQKQTKKVTPKTRYPVLVRAMKVSAKAPSLTEFLPRHMQPQHEQPEFNNPWYGYPQPEFEGYSSQTGDYEEQGYFIEGNEYHQHRARSKEAALEKVTEELKSLGSVVLQLSSTKSSKTEKSKTNTTTNSTTYATTNSTTNTTTNTTTYATTNATTNTTTNATTNATTNTTTNATTNATTNSTTNATTNTPIKPKEEAEEETLKADLGLESKPKEPRGKKALPPSTSQWTSAEQKLLEDGLRMFAKDDLERWDKIAAMIPGRTKKDCIERYRAIVQALKEKSKK